MKSVMAATLVLRVDMDASLGIFNVLKVKLGPIVLTYPAVPNPATVDAMERLRVGLLIYKADPRPVMDERNSVLSRTVVDTLEVIKATVELS